MGTSLGVVAVMHPPDLRRALFGGFKGVTNSMVFKSLRTMNPHFAASPSKLKKTKEKEDSEHTLACMVRTHRKDLQETQ